MRACRTICLKWIHTSDTHSDLFGYNYHNNQATSGGLSTIFSYVQKQKKIYEERLFVTDGGDCLQGQPLAYYYNFVEPHVPHLVAEVMNEMGYVCGVMGNHDIEVGEPTFARWSHDCNFPVLGANVIDKRTGKSYLQPYVIVNRCGIKIAVLGLVTPVIPFYQPKTLWPNLEFNEIAPSAKHWVKYIQENEQPDLLIGVFHCGYEGGFDIDGICHENAVKIVAEQIPGFDLICYGHDHVPAVHRIKNVNGDEVVCLGAICKDGYFAEADIKLTIKDGKIESKVVKGKLLKFKIHHKLFSSKNDNLSLQNKYSSHVRKVAQWASVPLCTLTDVLDEKEAYFGSCSFIDYIHQIQFDMTGAEISFVAPCSYHARLSQGVIYVRDIFPLLGYEDFVYKLRMKGTEIKGLLEDSYGRWINTMQCKEDHLLRLRNRNANVSVLDKLKRVILRLIQNRTFQERTTDWVLQSPAGDLYSAAGLVYSVDASKPVGKRVSIASMANGVPFALDKEYNVAVTRRLLFDSNGVIAKGACLHSKDIPQRIVSVSEKALPYHMLALMPIQKTVTPKRIGQWNFIPKELVSTAIETDRNLLFPIAI